MPAQSQSPQLHISVAPELQRVEPGEEAAFLVTIENRGREAQAQDLQVSGIPEAWLTVDFDRRHRAFAGEESKGSILIKVPRDAEPEHHRIRVSASAAGNSSWMECELEVFNPNQPSPVRAPAPEPEVSLPAAPGLSLAPSQAAWSGPAQGPLSVTVNVRNVGTQDADYELELEGIAASWYTLSGVVHVPARQARDTTIVFNPPGQARQGDYAYRVRASAAGQKEISAETAGRMTIAAPVQAQTEQRPIAAVNVERAQETRERVQRAPVAPPEIALAPRSTFRFGPGEMAGQATITITNRSPLIERYHILVRGIDEDWYQLAMTEVSLEPEKSAQVPLRLTPRIGPQSPAGEYSFRIRVTPQDFPDSFAETGGQISIAGVASFDARLTPIQTTGRKEKFKLTLVNTGGVALSPWLEASDPQGTCKFNYVAPQRLEVGEQAVVPIWVGASRQGLVGNPRSFDFRVRVSPAGGVQSSARSFEARFVHQPFLGSRMLWWSLLVALIAAIAGMVLVLGTSSVSRAYTTIRCGVGDTYSDPSKADQKLVKEACFGAPSALQKGFFGGEDATPGASPSPSPQTTAVAGGGGTTPAAGACTGDAQLALAKGGNVKLRSDAIIRETPAGTDTGKRGEDRSGVIVDGPQCAEDLVWWQVRTDATLGWTAEKDKNSVQLIIKQ